MAEITFNKLLQNTHEYNCENADENAMVSKIDLTYKNRNFTVEVKQPFCVNFEDTEGIELIIPDEKILKELNYSDLSDRCEDYYRGLIGSTGSGIRIEGGTNIRMYNNTFMKKWKVDVSLASDNGTTW
ncbi:MAG TPA: hypothetical protein EYH42_06495 [Sulfurovum sp.]|nr:hypothetical protein [Sulfurovum sp.]